VKNSQDQNLSPVEGVKPARASWISYVVIAFIAGCGIFGPQVAQAVPTFTNTIFDPDTLFTTVMTTFAAPWTSLIILGLGLTVVVTLYRLFRGGIRRTR